MLTAHKITIFRGDRLILSNLSFLLRPSCILLLRGANGTGKTSLLRALAGLTPLAAGELLWNDQPALADRTHHALRIGWLGHQNAIKPALTAAEQVKRASLSLVGLEAVADLPARLLSAGQTRRLAIARMASTAKPLWLLDEPTTGLDKDAINHFITLCQAQQARGGMIIASTHTDLDLPGAETLVL